MTSLRELAASPVPRLRADQRDELLRVAEHAELALRAGVGLTLTDYLEADWLTRRALIAAADSLRGLAAQRAGLAALGPLGAAMAGADMDGGAAAESVYLAQQTALAVADIQTETERALRGA